MSYDFWLELPADLREKKRRGGALTEAQARRLKRARELLEAAEPGLRIDDDETMLTAYSAEIGDVYVERERVSLAMSLGSAPEQVYRAIHGLMKRFDGEGYVAVDAQRDTPVVFAASFPEFMRQYRDDFRCSDDEFALWCSGIEPPSWIRRREARERGGRIAADVLQRGATWSWQQVRDASDEALRQHYDEIVAQVDALVAGHGLGEYLQALSDDVHSISFLWPRRMDGTYYPISEFAPWFHSSVLHYESTLLGEMRSRQLPGSAHATPQRLVVVFEFPADDAYGESRKQQRIDLIARMASRLRDAGALLGHDGHIRVEAAEYNFHGDDVDALHAGLRPLLGEATAIAAVHIRKRYGDQGSREITLSWAEAAG
jgi:hypothetical protein